MSPRKPEEPLQKLDRYLLIWTTWGSSSEHIQSPTVSANRAPLAFTYRKVDHSRRLHACRAVVRRAGSRSNIALNHGVHPLYLSSRVSRVCTSRETHAVIHVHHTCTSYMYSQLPPTALLATTSYELQTVSRLVFFWPRILPQLGDAP